MQRYEIIGNWQKRLANSEISKLESIYLKKQGASGELLLVFS